ncbi:energy-coupling factor ABC transporter ATP-binding protein [Chloroflexus sp.]|uniref:energy-coupling factor ABC transporter ATP-binding protein n=1 Tax=Chloroflexus sp. TaxID=1904827 RepID=UPI002606C6B7|nr:ABC transporter ATP-binding protein [uncultured Chloroflexus sp.]
MLTIAKLIYHYPDGTPALRGIDLTINAGEKVALLGVNGAGKSTLLHHLNGTLRPTNGTVVVDGLPVIPRNLPRIRSLVGVVFQDPDDQLFSPTVFEDVAFGPLHLGLALTEVEQRVRKALAAVDMKGYERRPPHRLSLGQRKRVALATVLSMQPKLLALDEPSAGLDPRGRRELSELLQALPQTMLVSTHDLTFAQATFPRAVVLAEGQVVADEATATLLADHDRLTRFGLA